MLRLIGDCHEKFYRYKQLIEDAEFSLQLGDLGFDYYLIRNVDPQRHKAIAGNHDNHDNLSPHFLDRFGVTCFGGIEFFYISGAFSVDYKRRTQGIDYFGNEELSHREGEAALELFIEKKPQLVISHDCPMDLVPILLDHKRKHGYHLYSEKVFKTRTGQILQACLDAHRPKMWIFGHHHCSWKYNCLDGTQFICLNELEVLDLPS